MSNLKIVFVWSHAKKDSRISNLNFSRDVIKGRAHVGEILIWQTFTPIETVKFPQFIALEYAWNVIDFSKLSD